MTGPGKPAGILDRFRAGRGGRRDGSGRITTERGPHVTIELTEQQRRLLTQAGDGPLTVTDPDTRTEYVLVRADEYAKLRAVVDGMTRRAGWDDPGLDEYERYRKRRQ